MKRIWIVLLLSFLHRTIALLAPIEDVYAADKFSINYLTRESWERIISNNATALSSGVVEQLGEFMSCYVPDSTSDAESMTEQYNETELNAILTSNLESGINIITKAFNGCTTYLSGFWNYEFCSDSGLAQFHGNSRTTSLYYVLGRAKQLIEDREFQLLYNDFGYYISELMGPGEICDVTGNPRVVEVQYICRPAAGPASIQWVREVKTCHYEIQVAIPQLCELELLSKSEDRKISSSIYCVKNEQEKAGVIDIIGYYKPTFIGNELYLLEPYDSINNRTALLYTGKLAAAGTPYEEEYAVNENFGNAISRMLLQQILLLPDGFPYSVNDKFAWMSEVFDFGGNYLTMVQFNLSSSLAEITLDSSLQFTSPRNFLFYERVEDNLRGDVSV